MQYLNIAKVFFISEFVVYFCLTQLSRNHLKYSLFESRFELVKTRLRAQFVSWDQYLEAAGGGGGIWQLYTALKYLHGGSSQTAPKYLHSGWFHNKLQRRNMTALHYPTEVNSPYFTVTHCTRVAGVGWLSRRKPCSWRKRLWYALRKKYDILWEFFPTWGGVFPIPKTFVILTRALKKT